MASESRMLTAAVIVARQAQLLAAPWSVRIPPSVRISRVTASSATISSQVGPSYPNEVRGVRHPVFGHGPRTAGPVNPATGRHDPPGWHWVDNQYRPFLAPAAEMKADEVAAEIARMVDDDAAALGYTVTPVYPKRRLPERLKF